MRASRLLLRRRLPSESSTYLLIWLAVQAASLGPPVASGTGVYEPCCGHTNHRAHVREFSCGKLYYRTLYLDSTKDVMYVGSMDKVFRLNLQNINNTNCETDALVLKTSSVSTCVSKGKSEHFDCRNHIRVIQPVGDGNRLYLCGTNAHNPKDWVIYSNLTHLGRQEYFHGIGDGIAKCPFDPNDNATAVWVERGNPGGLPALYSGTVAEFTRADTVIFRTNLMNQTTGQKMYLFKRTIKYDSKWLDKPNFVGSYDIGDYVYFFFRETAVEYINCGKNIYSRVARVCKKTYPFHVETKRLEGNAHYDSHRRQMPNPSSMRNSMYIPKMDTGGKNFLNQNWATFLKARLNCSIPGEFPFYFNEIQSVYKLPDDDTKFFAVFTTSMNGLMGSAICSFSINDVQETFNGKFKEQATSSSAWLPVLNSKVPEPRPGQCVNDTQTLPDTVLNFIRGHPLMDSAVPHEHDSPVFYKRDLIFTHLVVDRVEIHGINYTVHYAGSSDGKVYKIVEWPVQDGSRSNLLDVFEVTTPDPIRAMQVSSKHKSLYVASDSRIRQVDIVMCRSRYNNCLRCIRDPYCGWDKDSLECKPYRSGLLQDIWNSTPGICDSCLKKRPLQVHWGQSVHLGCSVNMPPSLTSDRVRWYHHTKDRLKHEVQYRLDKYIETSDGGLVILTVNEYDNGRYDCTTGSDTLCSYNISVNTKTCSAPDESQYRKIYSDWCHEFEKYKLAMKSWQTRQSSCQSQNQNAHPNDVTFQNKNPFV